MKTSGSYLGLTWVRTLIYIANFANFWKLSQVSPFPPFHDYQKYIPVKCTPRFSSLDLKYHLNRVPGYMVLGYEAWKAWSTFNWDIFLIIVRCRKGGNLTKVSKFCKVCKINQRADYCGPKSDPLIFIFHPKIFLLFPYFFYSLLLISH